ncbi:helix-turn-helix domain-containing protein, partial [Streptomyces sp. NPDC005373]|uniref:helix-turn-helix domain-containing protein n=1 Tax=Streptomyces sp. NPDC005373 TaxID=3156879 RepID=UPI0033AF32ED
MPHAHVPAVAVRHRSDEPLPTPVTGTGLVIWRTLQILGAFSAQRPHLSLSELARKADMPVSTAHRMLGDLLAAGKSRSTRILRTTV